MRPLREFGASHSTLLAWIGILLSIVGSAVICTLFVVDRIQGVADTAAARYATREEIRELAADVRAIRDDTASIKERLARAGVAPGGGR